VRTLYGYASQLYDESQEARLGSGALPVGEYPEALLDNVSAGARVTSTYGGVDLGLGYYYGWDHLPFITVDRDLPQLLEQIEQQREIEFPVRSEYLRQHTVELDLVTYVWDVGVRLESAFKPNATAYTVGLLPRRYPTLTSALALSYEESESLAFQVEGVWLHLFDVRPGEKLVILEPDYIGLIGMFLLGLDEFDRLRPTALADLSFRVVGFVGLNTREWLLYPSAAYRFNDAVEVGLGGMFFEGPEPTAEDITVGGYFDTNDQLFLSIDVAF
jgi:hypothetical protein